MRDGYNCVLDANTGEVIRRFKCDGYQLFFSLTPDSKFTISHDHKTILLHDLSFNLPSEIIVV